MAGEIVEESEVNIEVGDWIKVLYGNIGVTGRRVILEIRQALKGLESLGIDFGSPVCISSLENFRIR